MTAEKDQCVCDSPDPDSEGWAGLALRLGLLIRAGVALPSGLADGLGL